MELLENDFDKVTVAVFGQSTLFFIMQELMLVGSQFSEELEVHKGSVISPFSLLLS